MAGETVYADLTVSSEALSPRLQPWICASQCPHRQKIALWIACIGNVILLASLVVLALQLENKKGKSRVNDSKWTNMVECNTSSDKFKYHLRSTLCNQTSVNSTCQVCSQHWHLHKHKCYQFPSTNTLKSWNDSQDDCSARNAQLLVIQDMEDLDFVTKNMLDMHYTYWIGLLWSLPMKKWKWATGSQVNHDVFKEQNIQEEKYCGTIKNKKIVSETCSTVLRWICQKDPIFI
ncbi:killer cell lectin-like receptor subfamily B member 1C isoform X1 [Anolis carolinensis]|uniref:killer cell lectin-like receptor subfamily B member 1C isoform X1 n=1 Tax=Anolis carolinensis TaxID=28377 RepID=UPI002F2B7367